MSFGICAACARKMIDGLFARRARAYLPPSLTCLDAVPPWRALLMLC